MVNVYELFMSEDKAKSWRDWYLRSYHPAGYGTRLRVFFDKMVGFWVVSGSRFASCD